MKKTLKVANITCANCAKTIENYFESVDDIQAQVHVTSRRVTFSSAHEHDDHELIEHLKIIGYHVILTSEDAKKQRRRDLFDLIIGTLFTLPLLYTMVHHLGLNVYMPMILMNGYVQWALTTPVFLYVGRRFFVQTYHQIKAKNLGMDALVVIGTTAAYMLSIYETLTNDMMPNLYFETTAVIIWMVLIGHTFENRVREKTSDALYSLMALGAKEARIKTEDGDLLIPIDDVKEGMIVRVFANETIPVDGKIIYGTSYIDEQMLTGESIPVVKSVGEDVFGATLNMMETIEIQVTKTGADTMLQTIINTVMETTSLKPPVQRVADKIASWFVPVVVFISILTFLAWYIIFRQPIDLAFSASIAVLVISCPCALGLATPTSISVGSGLAFKQGILYKGGSFFEETPKLDMIAFDKTGTLTEGKPQVIHVEGEVLGIAAALENHTNHPLAKAILDAYKEKPAEAINVVQHIGLGIEGTLNHESYYVGSEKYMQALGHTHVFDTTSYRAAGQIVIFVASAKDVLGFVVLSDTIKKDAQLLIDTLKDMQLRPLMITGDHESTASHIAKQLGIDDFVSNVLPKEKADVIKQYQESGYHIAFVGDGMNDAPALKIANVGFAVKSGHDVALDAADVTLMHHDMYLVIDAIQLSKATLKNIKINFLWAFMYNVILIPVAAMGLLNPSLAGIGMAFSSIMVVLNALSLKRFRFSKGETL